MGQEEIIQKHEGDLDLDHDQLLLIEELKKIQQILHIKDVIIEIDVEAEVGVGVEVDKYKICYF